MHDMAFLEMKHLDVLEFGNINHNFFNSWNHTSSSKLESVHMCKFIHFVSYRYIKTWIYEALICP
jgi:hypothetical protein